MSQRRLLVLPLHHLQGRGVAGRQARGGARQVTAELSRCFLVAFAAVRRHSDQGDELNTLRAGTLTHSKLPMCCLLFDVRRTALPAAPAWALTRAKSSSLASVRA